MYPDQCAMYTVTVPARVGGVDLSTLETIEDHYTYVPARVGGVDLSSSAIRSSFTHMVPARVGGVDLSKYWMESSTPPRESPPVWAGWI